MFPWRGNKQIPVESSDGPPARVPVRTAKSPLLGYRVRLWEPYQDADPIHRIEREIELGSWAPDKIGQILKFRGGRLFVVEPPLPIREEFPLAGWLGCCQAPPVGMHLGALLRVAVHPHFQGQGFGTKLLDTFDAHLSVNHLVGAALIPLRTWHVPIIGLLTKRGWRATERRKGDVLRFEQRPAGHTNYGAKA
jgi:GNAT superfamily N-acetyltransferase